MEVGVLYSKLFSRDPLQGWNTTDMVTIGLGVGKVAKGDDVQVQEPEFEFPVPI